MPLNIEDIINECSTENHTPDNQGEYYKNYEDIKNAIKFYIGQIVDINSPARNLFNKEINFLSIREFESLLLYSKLQKSPTAEDDATPKRIYKSLEQDLYLELTGKHWYHYLPQLTKLTPIGIALIFAGIGLSTLLNYIDDGKPADAVKGIPGPTIALIGGFLIMTDLLLWTLNSDYKKQLAQLFQFVHDEPEQRQKQLEQLQDNLLKKEETIKLKIKPLGWFSHNLLYAAAGICMTFGLAPIVYMALTAGGTGSNRSMMALPAIAQPVLLTYLAILQCCRIRQFNRTRKELERTITDSESVNRIFLSKSELNPYNIQ